MRYEIRPVGDLKPGLEPVPSNGLEFAYVAKRDSHGKAVLENGKPVKERVKAYSGKVRPLAYLVPAAISNDVFVTTRRGPFRSTFTNGILAAQWLSNVLKEDGVIEPDELIKKISNPDDPHRKYLAGDVIPLLHEIFKREGQFYLGLYELEDEELENLLVETRSGYTSFFQTRLRMKIRNGMHAIKRLGNDSWMPGWIFNTGCSITVFTSAITSLS